MKNLSFCSYSKTVTRFLLLQVFGAVVQKVDLLASSVKNKKVFGFVVQSVR